MTPSFGARCVIALLRAGQSKKPLDGRDSAAVIAARAKLDKLDALTARLNAKALRRYTIREIALGGVPTLEVTLPGAQGRDLVVIHGGGFFFRSIMAHSLFAGRMLDQGGFGRALLPLYRLAPEHPWPAAAQDCLAAWQALDTGQAALIGASAGGALALGMMVAARDTGLALPHAAALLSPMTDLTFSAPSIAENATRDPFFGRGPMVDLAYYLGGADPVLPLVSPLWADLAGLPPILALAGSTERLRDDSTRLVPHAQVEVWPDMPHVFPTFNFAEARAARSRLADFLR